MKKLFSRRAVVSAVTAVSILFVLLLVFIALKTVNQYYSLSPLIARDVVIEKMQIKPGLPKQLIIPAINVDVAIDYVGLTSDGAMDIKPDPKIVGWYMLGPRPGDEGSSVIAGHYGWLNGKPAIFNDIQKLSKGDELSVIDQKGVSVTFVVREIHKYDPESDAATVFKSNDGKSHLNLITCNGVWENDKQSYSNRLVVFTDRKT